MKQRQSGHAVKGPAYGCSHITRGACDLSTTYRNYQTTHKQTMTCNKQAAGKQVEANGMRKSSTNHAQQYVYILFSNFSPYHHHTTGRHVSTQLPLTKCVRGCRPIIAAQPQTIQQTSMKHSHANDKNSGTNAHTQILSRPSLPRNRVSMHDLHPRKPRIPWSERTWEVLVPVL